MFSGEGEGARLLTGGTHHKSYGGEDYVSEKEDENTTWELEQHDEDYSRNPHIEEAARTIASAANLRTDVPDSANLSPVEKFFYVNIKYFRWVALTLMLVFTFFEKPWWCYQYPANCAQTDVYLNSGFEQLPQFVTDMIQFVCLMVLSFDLIIHYRVFGQHILKDITVFLRTGIIVVSVIDTFVALVWVSYHDTIFISPFLRPCLFAIVSPQVRTKIIQIVRIVPIIAELLALLGLLLFSFSWFGVLLFFDDEQLLPNTEQDTAYFSSFWDALLSLFVLLTTANNPDVRMPVFWSARPSFLFFAIFLIIGLYFLLPFIFSSVYNHYKNVARDMERANNDVISEALVAGFEILDRGKTGTIDIALYKQLIQELSHYSRQLSLVVDDHSDQILELIDKDQINENEFEYLFTHVCKLEPKTQNEEEAIIGYATEQRLSVVIRVTKPISDWHASFRTTYTYSFLETLVENPWFEHCIDILLVINGLLMLFQTYLLVSLTPTEYEDLGILWDTVEWTFVVCWVFEMVAKLLVLGFWGYIHHPEDVFAGAVTIVSLACGILSIWIDLNKRVVRIIMVIRSLHLLHFLSRMRKFRVIFSSFIQLIPFFLGLIGTLIFQYVLFGLIGVRAYGGLIYVNNPALNGTDYASRQYFPNNFNDLPTACVVMFDLMVVNNWNVYMEAIVQLTNQGSRLFFILFWFCTNMLTLNLLVANIVDVVSNQIDDSLEEVKEEEKLQQIKEGKASLHLSVESS